MPETLPPITVASRTCLGCPGLIYLTSTNPDQFLCSECAHDLLEYLAKILVPNYDPQVEHTQAEVQQALGRMYCNRAWCEQCRSYVGPRFAMGKPRRKGLETVWPFEVIPPPSRCPSCRLSVPS